MFPLPPPLSSWSKEVVLVTNAVPALHLIYLSVLKKIAAVCFYSYFDVP